MDTLTGYIMGGGSERESSEAGAAEPMEVDEAENVDVGELDRAGDGGAERVGDGGHEMGRPADDPGPAAGRAEDIGSVAAHVPDANTDIR